MAILTGDYFEDLEESNENIEYTVYVSGLVHGGMDALLTDSDAEENIAIVFDVVTDHSLSLKAKKTSYPVESGVKISDHVTIEDGSISFTAHVTSAPLILTRYNIIDRDTDFENPKQSERPTKALEILRKIQIERKLVTLTTEDAILTDYVLTSLDAKRSGDDGDKLVFSLTFEEFRKVEVGRTVLATNTTDPKKAGKKNKGADAGAAGGKEPTDYTDKPNTLTDKGTQKVLDARGAGMDISEHVTFEPTTPSTGGSTTVTP